MRIIVKGTNLPKLKIGSLFVSRPSGARRGSRDAPFHSPTADIASPFQNISFPNASSSRWITNLSITSLSLSFPGEESRVPIRPSVSVSSLFKISQRTLLLFSLFFFFRFFSGFDREFPNFHGEDNV